MHKYMLHSYMHILFSTSAYGLLLGDILNRSIFVTQLPVTTAYIGGKTSYKLKSISEIMLEILQEK